MLDTQKQGEIVILREFNGNAIKGRVWGTIAGSVLINDETNFLLRCEGKPFLESVGFPVEDVFRYDEHAFQRLQNGKGDWSQMMLWELLP